MSKKNISYVKGYEHSDFTDLLNELQGKNENTEMIDGAYLMLHLQWNLSAHMKNRKNVIVL